MTRPPEAKVIVGAVLVGAACAWLGFAGLSGLAQPAHLKGRLAGVETLVSTVERAPRAAGDPAVYATHALCRTDPSLAGPQLQARVAAAAAQAGLSGAKLTLSPSDAASGGEQLTPVMFALDVQGRYDAVLLMLKLLAEGGPQIFADSLDLTSQTSAVSMHFTGRVLCSTSAA